MTRPEIMAGGSGPHGRHEDRREGWDPAVRVAYGEDPDAATRGRHTAPTTTEEPK